MYYDKETITPHEKKACELFSSGYNCAQAVFAAFSDLTGISEKDSAMMISAFGGGMSGQRRICGTVSAMLMVAGCLTGYSEADDYDGKVKLYKNGAALAKEFESLFSTQICSELLRGIKLSPTPSVRDAEYYKVRPCVKFCAAAANILDNWLVKEMNYDIR